MKIFILSILISSSVLATEYCGKFSFSSGKLECLKLASNNYVSDNLGEFCVDYITFDSDKLNCIKLGLNKYYRKVSLDVCAQLTFNSEKLECVKVAGSTNSLKKTYILLQSLLNNTKEAIEEGDDNKALSNTYRAEFIIEELIENVSQ